MDDLLTPAEVWCSKCDQPATATRTHRIDGHRWTRAYCDQHDPEPAVRPIPAAITDPWLRSQWDMAVNGPIRRGTTR